MVEDIFLNSIFCVSEATSTTKLTCSSKGNQSVSLETRCDAGGRILRLELDQQFSIFPCRKSLKNYGSFQNDVWVSNGCGATFIAIVEGIISFLIHSKCFENIKSLNLCFWY